MARRTTHRITNEQIEAAARGDRAAAGEVADFIYGWVENILRSSPGDIDDAVNDTFVAVLTAVRTRQYDPTQSDKQAWVAKIATRKALDVLRRRKGREVPFDDELHGPASPDPVSRIERQQSADRVNDLLNELREEDRALLMLRYKEELSQEEIADTLELPVGTIKSRLSRLRQHLLARLGPSTRRPDDV
jgi:RNA polymerase sigma-70 factor (ECF subfamily)